MKENHIKITILVSFATIAYVVCTRSYLNILRTAQKVWCI